MQYHQFLFLYPVVVCLAASVAALAAHAFLLSTIRKLSGVQPLPNHPARNHLLPDYAIPLQQVASVPKQIHQKVILPYKPDAVCAIKPVVRTQGKPGQDAITAM